MPDYVLGLDSGFAGLGANGDEFAVMAVWKGQDEDEGKYIDELVFGRLDQTAVSRVRVDEARHRPECQPRNLGRGSVHHYRMERMEHDWLCHLRREVQHFRRATLSLEAVRQHRGSGIWGFGIQDLNGSPERQHVLVHTRFTSMPKTATASHCRTRHSTSAIRAPTLGWPPLWQQTPSGAWVAWTQNLTASLKSEVPFVHVDTSGALTAEVQKWENVPEDENPPSRACLRRAWRLRVPHGGRVRIRSAASWKVDSAGGQKTDTFVDYGCTHPLSVDNRLDMTNFTMTAYGNEAWLSFTENGATSLLRIIRAKLGCKYPRKAAAKSDCN